MIKLTCFDPTAITVPDHPLAASRKTEKAFIIRESDWSLYLHLLSIYQIISFPRILEAIIQLS